VKKSPGRKLWVNSNNGASALKGRQNVRRVSYASHYDLTGALRAVSSPFEGRVPLFCGLTQGFRPGLFSLYACGILARPKSDTHLGEALSA
jgi:hypothetical protein